MVVSMMKWRPWPPIQSKKFEVKIVVRCLSGLQRITGDDDHDDGEKKDEKIRNFDGLSRLTVEIRWKGSKTNGLRSLKKKSVKKDTTSPQELGENGVVEWEEEFKTVCGFCGSKDKFDEGVFDPWEVAFSVFNDSQMDAKKKGSLAAPVVVNLAEFASLEEAKEMDMKIPLSMFGFCFGCCPSLCISLWLMELRPTNDLTAEVQRPILFAPLSPCFGGASLPKKKDEDSSFKAKMRKVKSLTDYVSSRKYKKPNLGDASTDSKFSTGSDSDYSYPFDTDSFDDSEEGVSEESREDTGVEKTCGYCNLVQANLAGEALDLKVNCNNDELIYYSHKQLTVDSSPAQEIDASLSESLPKSPKLGILAWRKRKLSFRSPKVKGEPLLKKDYGEEGGDDIDFDRRQLSADESMVESEESMGSGSLFSEFGDDKFAVGSWEVKELPSRDGSMKLRTQVFFASIDQRSERVAGESACTTLVAVIADWLHSNRGEMPIKSEFDSLIREGALQWRSLCENEDYKERFPDKHFDLDTVLEAKIRPLVVFPERSFIGFFHPEGLEEECFHFLKDSMSFDDIWVEICKAASKLNRNSEPLVYVVSWNDHFFLLRVDWDAFYIIDTLGERLFEGCNQAFVLKFDKDTTIEKVPTKTPTKDEKDSGRTSPRVESSSSKENQVNREPLEEKSGSNATSEIISAQRAVEEEDVVVFRGKESCKEYIKIFLAAIPIRELQVDMKKGLRSSTPLHHRLQVEFNYTAQILSDNENSAAVMEGNVPPLAAANVQASTVVDVPADPAQITEVETQLCFFADVEGLMTNDIPASMMAVVTA